MSNDYNGKKRSELPDSIFGIPQERKYPMPDEKHTRSAIKLFNHVDPKYEEQLAKAVIKNMKKYGIDGSAVGPNNRLRKYLPKDMIKESAARPLIYTWERTNIPEYPVIRESSHKSDFSYSGIKTSAEKSEFKRDFREVFKEDPTESSINYMQMIKYKGSLVGYIGFSRYKEGKKKYLGIGNFMIIKRYQHSGIGSKVISDIIDRYKDNYDEIYCYVDKDNTSAIAFYKKIAKVNTDNLTRYGYYVTLYKKGSTNESVSILPQDTGITTVIFDLGDVLVSANIKDYLVADPEVPNEIVDELLKLWFIDKDEVDDTMDLDTYREIVNKRMGVEFSKYIPKLFKYNVDCVTAFDYTIPMIQDLKDKGYKVYYLSNWSAWTHDLLQEAGKFDFLNLMDGGVFSYDVGYMKPDEEIYKILINKYKINPEEAVFFDDREENIEAANKLGIHGVHFPRHDSSIVYNSLKVMQIAHEIFNMSDSFKPCDMPEFITFSPKPALETVCMDIEIIPGASVTQDDDGSVKAKSYNKRYYDYDTVMQSFIEAAKREDFPISIKNGNDRFEYTPSTKEKPYGEVEGVSISKGGFTEETIQEELAKHSIAIENQHMVAKSSLNIIKPVIFNNDGYRKRAKDLNLKLRCDLLPVKGTTINIRVLDRYQKCEDPGSAKQLLDDIKESCVTVANKLSGTFRYYVEEVTTDDKGCLNFHIKKMKVVSYNSDNEVMKEEDMEYPDFPVVLNIDSDITTVDIDKTLKESSIQEYGTTGGTIVGSNQPDSVYIVNYMQNNVFSGYKEPKQAICKKGMNQMYTTKNGKAIPVDIDKFKEEASDISVFRFKETPILSFDKIIENASVDGDFYMLLTGDYPTNQYEIEYDNRFVQEENFFDKLDDITYCTESTIIGQIETTDYPYMKILTESMEGRCWNYYRDINGVFAMNELTGLRTPSYEDITDIPNSQIQLIERGTVYFGD